MSDTNSGFKRPKVVSNQSKLQDSGKKLSIYPSLHEELQKIKSNDSHSVHEDDKDEGLPTSRNEPVYRSSEKS